jgi:hypothetical protein
MEAVVIRRWWVGLVIAVLGAAGLAVGWLLDGDGNNAAVLAVLSAFAVAAGSLLAANAAGEVALRATGGLLFMAGLAVIITHHEVWWWLPNNWVTPMSLTAFIISLAGLGVLLLAYGFRLAWLSGALGMLALTCLGLTLLPYGGSDDQEVLQAIATALGGIALTIGVHAFTARTRLHRRSTASAAAVAATAILYAGYDAYGHTPSGGYHTAVLGATGVGAVASLLLAVTFSWPAVAGLFRSGSRAGFPRAPAPEPAPEPAPSRSTRSDTVPLEAPFQPTADPAASPGTTEPATPSTGSGPPTTQATAVSATATTSPTSSRLQTASLVVGLVIGLITIAKELIAAVLAVIP